MLSLLRRWGLVLSCLLFVGVGLACVSLLKALLTLLTWLPTTQLFVFQRLCLPAAVAAPRRQLAFDRACVADG